VSRVEVKWCKKVKCILNAYVSICGSFGTWSVARGGGEM